jgi:hypothetical protein
MESLKFFIGTPAYDGRVHVQYAMMLMDIDEILKSNGHQVIIRIPTMGSLLVANRNRLVEMFWQSGADWLVCIDSDLSFDAKHILEIVNSGKKVFAGVYPLRDHKSFVFRPVTDDTGKIDQCPKTGYLKMEYVPAGFMMIHRSVIEKMREMYPQLYYESKVDNPISKGFAFFDTEIYDGEFWGEDYVFCRRVTAAGFDIWTDPNILFNHAGVIGSFIEALTDDPTKAKVI